jgi:hypothetical protein
MTTTDCWADPLTRKERREVAGLLARASHHFWAAAEPRLPDAYGAHALAFALAACSAEMADLRIDVTERAEDPVIVQARKRAAELFEMAEDPNFLGI